MSSAPATDPQTELATLATRLEDRASVVHFVWSFGLSCVGFVSGGVAIKLFRDSVRAPKFAFALAAVAAGCALVALFRLLRGLRLHATELAEFQRLLALRRQLGLDQPQLPSLPSP